jgi:hypothetical protein
VAPMVRRRAGRARRPGQPRTGPPAGRVMSIRLARARPARALADHRRVDRGQAVALAGRGQAVARAGPAVAHRDHAIDHPLLLERPHPADPTRWWLTK